MQLFHPSVLRRGLYQGSAQCPPCPLCCSPEGRTKSLSLPLSLGGSGAGQAEPPPFPGAAPPVQPHRSPLFPPARGQLRPQAPPAFPLRRATVPYPHRATISKPPEECRPHAACPSTLGSRQCHADLRLGDPPIPPPEPWGLGHVAPGSWSRGPWLHETPTWHPWPSRVGRRGGTGECESPGRALPPLPLAPAPAASQSASGSAALFPPPPRLSPLRGTPATAPPRGPEANRARFLWGTPVGTFSLSQLDWSQPSTQPIPDRVMMTIAT